MAVKLTEEMVSAGELRFLEMSHPEDHDFASSPWGRNLVAQIYYAMEKAAPLPELRTLPTRLTADGLDLAIATQQAREKLGELDVTVSIPGFIDLCQQARTALSTNGERERLELLQRDQTIERMACVVEDQIAVDVAHGRLQADSILKRAAAAIRALKTVSATQERTDG